MRYHQFAYPHASPLNNNFVLLNVRRGEMPRLEALIAEMDVRISGPIRRMPSGNAFVEIDCGDGATASTLRSRW